MKMGKRLKAAYEKIDADKKYSLDEGLQIIVDQAQAKFDETLEVAISLGVDSSQSDQQVRGAVVLPQGCGKSVVVVALAKGNAEKEAQEAGADFVGAEDLIEKIQGGWLDFDRVVTTPDMMSSVAKVARVLGPRGLMPNPKLGTVTPNISEAVKSEKKGKCDFRVDKVGVVHAAIGKKSQGVSALKENYKALLEGLIKAKPSSSKGVYLKSIYLSSSQGPALLLNPSEGVG